MTPGSGPTAEARGSRSLLMLALLAPVVGAAAGLVGAVFRLSLEQADRLRNLLVGWAHGQGPVGLMTLVAACAAGAMLAAWLVRRVAPQASGSGIPHVEAVIDGALPPAPFRPAPGQVRSAACWRSDLAWRWGARVRACRWVRACPPIGRLFRRSQADCGALLAAGAGAGLATAFNAPFAGAIFVLEELVRRFEPRIAIATLGASASAIAVLRPAAGSARRISPSGAAPTQRLMHLPLFALLGLARRLSASPTTGILGALARARRLAAAGRAARRAVGVAVALVAWLAPALVGGGDPTHPARAAGAGTLAMIPALFLVSASPGRPLLRRRRRPAGCSRRSCRSAPPAASPSDWPATGRCCPASGSSPRASPLSAWRRFFAGMIRAAADRHRAGHRDDRSLQMLLPMLCRLLRRDAGPDAAPRPGDLRHAARPPAPARRPAGGRDRARLRVGRRRAGSDTSDRG